MFYNLTKNIEYINSLDVKNLQNAMYDWIKGSLNYQVNIILSSIEHVHPKNLDTLKSDGSKVIFNFSNEIRNYLYHQDLRCFLGVRDQYFNCFIHNDHNRSASVFQKDDGTWLYKCFYDGCEFKIGDITKLTECFTGLNRPDALDFLMQVYNISLEKNEWQLHQEKILDANIELLLDVDFMKKNYPYIYQKLKNSIPQLIILHEYAKRNVSINDIANGNVAVFSVSVRQLAQELRDNNLTGNVSTVCKHNNLLIFAGLLNKLKDSDVPQDELERFRKYAEDRGYKRYENFYSIPSYSYNILNSVENKAKEFIESGMSIGYFSKEMIKRGFGDNEANRVFPRQINELSNDLDNKVAKFIERKVLSEIKNKGYCIESKLYSNGNFIRSIRDYLKITDKRLINKQSVERVFKIILPELINSYDIKRSRFTNVLKEKFNAINFNGSPNILYIKD